MASSIEKPVKVAAVYAVVVILVFLFVMLILGIREFGLYVLLAAINFRHPSASCRYPREWLHRWADHLGVGPT
jgi:hypothetical protein